jgi:YD repeat-containing protein
LWNAGATELLAASYQGDKTTGELNYSFETAATLRMQVAAVVNRRAHKLVNLKQGVKSTTIVDYGDTIDIDPGTSVVTRNTENVTEQRTWLGDRSTGTLMTQTDTTYFHPTGYLDQNLLHLAASQTLTDPARGILSRIDYAYDEFGLNPSGSPNLDTTVGSARGNVTTVTTYRQPATLTGAASSHKNYFDSGDIRQSIDANGNVTSMTYDFVPCSATHTLSTSSVANAKGHQITTVTDCFSNQPVRVIDPNNNSVFTQYDTLGRIVETAATGDTLTPIPGFIRHPSAPLNGGFAIGNNGQGPTSWTEYLSLGVINQQRTVVHAKDGTANGRYAKTFTDGLGRTIQTRSKVDPSTSGGNAEVVSTTVYDNMGRVSTAFVPCFATSSDTVTGSCTAQSTVTSYDALGRVTSLRPAGLPASTSSYTASTTELIATAIDANGNQTQTFTDVMGRVVRSARQSSNCVGGWCTTLMEYDAAGRLLRTTDPGGNIMLVAYDGLGRKTEMTDPDMGHWTYEYDNNGNLTRQVDAKGQVIQMSYDVLNRLKVKDLPPNSAIAGAEDTTYFYDGEQAP